MKKKELRINKPEYQDLEELNLREGFGIFSDNISLTQNIGCTGGNKPNDKTNKNSKSTN